MDVPGSTSRTVLGLNEFVCGDHSPVPRESSSAVLLDLWLQPDPCPLVDTKDGAPGGGGARSETETVIKSFFIPPSSTAGGYSWCSVREQREQKAVLTL